VTGPTVVCELTVLSRPGCHLCEEAVEALEPRCRAHGIRLHLVDVDGDQALRERFGLRIPVVMAGNVEISAWPLDEARLAAWFARDA